MEFIILLLGITIGRNFNEIYSRTKADSYKAYQALVSTKAAGTCSIMVEAIFIVLIRKAADSRVHEHNMLYPCRKFVCAECGGRPLSMRAYHQRIKAIG